MNTVALTIGFQGVNGTPDGLARQLDKAVSLNATRIMFDSPGGRKTQWPEADRADKKGIVFALPGHLEDTIRAMLQAFIDEHPEITFTLYNGCLDWNGTAPNAYFLKDEERIERGIRNWRRFGFDEIGVDFLGSLEPLKVEQCLEIGLPTIGANSYVGFERDDTARAFHTIGQERGMRIMVEPCAIRDGLIARKRIPSMVTARYFNSRVAGGRVPDGAEVDLIVQRGETELPANLDQFRVVWLDVDDARAGTYLE